MWHDPAAAQMEWCALAVTLMEIERKSGWVAASEYLRLLLADRVPTGQPLAEADEPLVFALERQALATPGAQRAPAQARTRAETCHDFNGAGGCRREVCRFAHACSTCGSGAHGRAACPTPASASVASSRSGRSRGSRGGARRQSPGASSAASTVASVKSDPRADA